MGNSGFSNRTPDSDTKSYTAVSGAVNKIEMRGRRKASNETKQDWDVVAAEEAAATATAPSFNLRPPA